jgi:hypothetical protein
MSASPTVRGSREQESEQLLGLVEDSESAGYGSVAPESSAPEDGVALNEAEGDSTHCVIMV